MQGLARARIRKHEATVEQARGHDTLPFQQRRDECRASLFNSLERQTLQPLPASAFEVKHSARYKVQQNYHVQLGRDRHFYSVPYALAHKEVEVRATAGTIEVLHG